MYSGIWQYGKSIIISQYLVIWFSIQFSNLRGLPTAVEATSVEVLEEKHVHLPEVPVRDDVDEHVHRIHPPVPGVANQVPKHIHLCEDEEKESLL